MTIRALSIVWKRWTKPKRFRLCLVPGKCERKKIGRKNGKKEKAKEMNINFFTCLVIHGKFKGKKKGIHFLLLGWPRKKVKEKWKENKINNLFTCRYPMINVEIHEQKGLDKNVKTGIKTKVKVAVDLIILKLVYTTSNISQPLKLANYTKCHSTTPWCYLYKTYHLKHLR